MTPDHRSREELVAALAPLAEALRADGYDLFAESDGAARARVTVVAGPEACPDCLVPEGLFATICADRLGAQLGGTWSVTVGYPAAEGGR